MAQAKDLPHLIEQSRRLRLRQFSDSDTEDALIKQ